MDANDILASAVSNLALLGATVGALAALRRGQRGRGVKEGICERCSGSGVQECSLCYGRGSIAQPGYVNVANAMHRRLCLRCEGKKTQSCQVCGGAHRHQSSAGRLLLPPLNERTPPESGTLPDQRARRRHEIRDDDDFIEF